MKRPLQASLVAPPVLFLIYFSLSCIIAFKCPTIQTGDQEKGTSFLHKLIGFNRIALSARFYELADTYFHKGIGHVSDQAFDSGFFMDLRNKIAPSGHVHLTGDQLKELMPWLNLAIVSNPSDRQLYLVTSFWLAESGHHDAAFELLNRGQINNPFCYDFKMQEGILFLKLEMYGKARKALEEALAFWPGPAGENSDAKYDRAMILTYLGAVLEHEGETLGAAECFEEVLTLFPERVSLARRTAELRSGLCPEDRAARMIKKMITDSAGHKCPREHENEAHHHDHGCEHSH